MTEYENYEALVYINDKWEKLNRNIIINQDIDLTNYINQNQLEEELSNYLTIEEVEQLISEAIGTAIEYINS